MNSGPCPNRSLLVFKHRQFTSNYNNSFSSKGHVFGFFRHKTMAENKRKAASIELLYAEEDNNGWAPSNNNGSKKSRKAKKQDHVAEENHGGEGSHGRYNKPPCAACKHNRKSCVAECVFAPFFPANAMKEYLKVHKVFGNDKVKSLLENSNDKQKTTDAILWVSKAFEQDPVRGPLREYERANKVIEDLRAELIRSQLLREPKIAANHMSYGFPGWSGNGMNPVFGGGGSSRDSGGVISNNYNINNFVHNDGNLIGGGGIMDISRITGEQNHEGRLLFDGAQLHNHASSMQQHHLQQPPPPPPPHGHIGGVPRNVTFPGQSIQNELIHYFLPGNERR